MNFRPWQMILFAIAVIVIYVGYTAIDDHYFPKPKYLTSQQKADVREAVAPLAALPISGTIADAWQIALNEKVRLTPQKEREELHRADAEEKKKKEELAKAELKPAPAPQKFEQRTVDLGNADFNLQVRLTNRGGGIKRLMVTHFKQVTKEGLLDTRPGHESLNLIPAPGDRDTSVPEWTPKPSPDDDLPSFLLYHYAEPNRERPENDLGEREWTLITPPPDPSSATQEASFTTQLKEFGLRITKTYTLAKGDYHVGLSVKLERIPGTTVLPFRYSLSSGRGLPIEGVWYTSVYRNCYIGWFEGDAARRHLDDSASVSLNAGGERMVRSGGMEFQYAAVANQFFASALCVDDRQDKRNFVEFVRATAEGNYPPDKPMLGDITARMISEELSVTDKPIEHKYLLYHGPVKVRLLHQMRGAQAVSEELIDRYETGLNLRTMTDYHSDNWLGRFADTIGWTWLTIKTTNLMHGLLGFLLQYLPAPLAILLVTVIVRGALHPLSRRQQLNTLKFQERMKQHEPALKRLEEQYKGRDPNEFQQAKLKYMMQNGLNPMSQLGGCLLIFLQMPIFMGLYYCLQENVFFRLNPLIPGFFWMKNLAAPDMLFWWTDKIPFISTPESLGSPLYLGPYFNLLPVIAAGFMFMQQKLMSPTPTDEQQRMQQSMFKYMMIVMVIMFYKVASGLALYFIASSIWGLVERKVIPKPKLKESPVSAASNNGKGKSLPAKQKPDGLIGRLREQLGDAWKRLLEAAEKK